MPQMVRCLPKITYKDIKTYSYWHTKKNKIIRVLKEGEPSKEL